MRLKPYQLRELRLKRKKLSSKDYTMAALADRIQISAPYYSNIENGRRNVSESTLEQVLVKGYGMTQKEAQATVLQWKILENFKRAQDLGIQAQEVHSLLGEAYKKNPDAILQILPQER